jgi:hypothetical protein
VDGAVDGIRGDHPENGPATRSSSNEWKPGEAARRRPALGAAIDGTVSPRVTVTAGVTSEVDALSAEVTRNASDDSFEALG